ncbi:hypothetical protein [Azospirillum lipoferum]|uniref:Uncharacterized protein n=1 Tax=Azospirillum lipoferum (strain 4B) TaxID=862719 RepID=G7ZBI6_AZOL4|nr:hypothetical protein [Azospirillum lipoferum]CBS88701.1 protein of unknown function [Azospirillum lipoferum 4B]
MAIAFARCDTRRRLDLEILVTWALRDQQADRVQSGLFDIEAAANDHGWEPQGVSGDGVAELLRRHETGDRVDGGGPVRGIAVTVHPDAEAVANAVGWLDPWQRRLVRFHGRSGTRPDWLPLVPPLVAVKRPSEARGRYRHVTAERWEFVPTRSELAKRYLLRGQSLFDARGQRRIVEEERGFHFRTFGDGRRQVQVKWCPLEPAHSDAEIVEANTDYAGWHAGMTALLERIGGWGLHDHVLTGFTAPAAPWEYYP